MQEALENSKGEDKLRLEILFTFTVCLLIFIGAGELFFPLVSGDGDGADDDEEFLGVEGLEDHVVLEGKDFVAIDFLEAEGADFHEAVFAEESLGDFSGESVVGEFEDGGGDADDLELSELADGEKVDDLTAAVGEVEDAFDVALVDGLDGESGLLGQVLDDGEKVHASPRG